MRRYAERGLIVDSFSNEDRQYSDGQNNREPIPDEIIAYGFKPPVKLPDGSIEVGDFLAANHLNYIFNDLYAKLAIAMVVVESFGDSTGGYRKFSNGDIEMWGRGGPNSTGDTTITFPVVLPATTRDLQVGSMMASTVTLDIHVTMVVDNSVTTTGFRTKSVARAATATNNTASTNAFWWRAYYHASA